MRISTAIALTLAGLAMPAIAQAEPQPPKVKRVFVVIKSHFDLGFTDQAENVFQRYRVEMMDKALGVIDRTRALPPEQRFVWTVPGWPLAAQMLGPKQDPDRKVRIEQAIRDGYLTVHALAGTTHTEALEPENLVRSLGFSSSVARTYGRPLPIAAKMTDVPSHSWIMPTLLHHAGIRFLHLGCNPASQYPRVPPLFWWEGGDGSRVLCAYTIDYGSGLTPPPGWPSSNYLAMIMAGDNAGPPGPEEVAKWRENLAKSMPGVEVRFGTLDDFAKAVLAEQPKLPVVRGDMPDTWIHGLMSNPNATNAARFAQAIEPALDSLDTHLKAWGFHPDSLTEPLAKAYEMSFLYGEHTWGMNAEYGPRTLYGDQWRNWLEEMEREPIPADGDYTKLPRGNKRKWLQSYEDHRRYALTANATTARELERRFQLLSENVNASLYSLVVHNPLPWPRGGIVHSRMNPIPHHVGTVPANGYVTIPNPTPAPARLSEGNVLVTPHYKATFDLKRGGISSLIEVSTGRELVDPASPYAFGQFLCEKFSTKEVFDRFFKLYSRIQGGWGLNDIGKPGMPDANKNPYREITPGAWTCSIAAHDAADIVTLTASELHGIATGVSIRFTFPRDERWIDVRWDMKKKSADKNPEGGWLCFPLAVPDPRFTVGRLGAPINPATDIIPGCNRHLMAVSTGVALSGSNGTGAAVCPLDSPLVSLDCPGLWRWSMDFVPKKPAVFVNLYNNMWNTNFPLWQDGDMISQVRFWPLENPSNPVPELAIRSWEARIPLMEIGNPLKKSGSLPPTASGLTVSRPGVLVTAFGANPDGPGSVLRLWDQTGIDGDVTVTFPPGFSKATPADLRGGPTGPPVVISNHTLTVPIKPFAPASFILESAKP
ncbi:MAG: hypothetical protein J0M04_07430 [Verrucomicrobia bacterium]|nr:hypothetical protein [Verrucomicrobiota bacterium]